MPRMAARFIAMFQEFSANAVDGKRSAGDSGP
jgi:hypothetical protein